MSQTFYTSVEADVRNGALDVSDLGRKFNVSAFSQQLGYRIDNLAGPLSVQGFITSSQPDYSSVLIQDAQGQSKPLSESSTTLVEWSSELSADLSLGTHLLSVTLGGTLSESPFTQSRASISYTRSFFNQTTAVSLSATYLNQAQPKSFYFDSNFRLLQRPLNIYGNELVLSADQVFTENWKGRWSLTTAERQNERPRNWGTSVVQAYALTDRLFSELRLNYATEGRSQTLLNERGYFDQWGFKTQLSYEPIYDLLLSVSYGQVIERESDPRDGTVLQVASDQYGIGVSYQFPTLLISLSTGYIESNTNIYNYTFNGGLTWRI